nr:hypothetical protein CFP56_74630 [Quercus suber]
MSMYGNSQRRYGYKEVNVAKWSDPRGSIHPARGGPRVPVLAANSTGKPYQPVYKVSYRRPPPQATDDEESEDEKQSGGDASEATDIVANAPVDSPVDPPSSAEAPSTSAEAEPTAVQEEKAPEEPINDETPAPSKDEPLGNTPESEQESSSSLHKEPPEESTAVQDASPGADELDADDAASSKVEATPVVSEPESKSDIIVPVDDEPADVPEAADDCKTTADDKIEDDEEAGEKIPAQTDGLEEAGHSESTVPSANAIEVPDNTDVPPPAPDPPCLEKRESKSVESTEPQEDTPVLDALPVQAQDVENPGTNSPDPEPTASGPVPDPTVEPNVDASAEEPTAQSQTEESLNSVESPANIEEPVVHSPSKENIAAVADPAEAQQEDNAVIESAVTPESEEEPRASTPEALTDDIEDKKVSWAPDTPEPKPTIRKKKSGKFSKSRGRKKLTIRGEPDPDDIMEIVDVVDGVDVPLSPLPAIQVSQIGPIENSGMAAKSVSTMTPESAKEMDDVLSLPTEDVGTTSSDDPVIPKVDIEGAAGASIVPSPSSPPLAVVEPAQTSSPKAHASRTESKNKSSKSHKDKEREYSKIQQKSAMKNGGKERDMPSKFDAATLDEALVDDPAENVSKDVPSSSVAAVVENPEAKVAETGPTISEDSEQVSEGKRSEVQGAVLTEVSASDEMATTEPPQSSEEANAPASLSPSEMETLAPVATSVDDSGTAEADSKKNGNSDSLPDGPGARVDSKAAKINETIDKSGEVLSPADTAPGENKDSAADLKTEERNLPAKEEAKPETEAEPNVGSGTDKVDHSVPQTVAAVERVSAEEDESSNEVKAAKVKSTGDAEPAAEVLPAADDEHAPQIEAVAADESIATTEPAAEAEFDAKVEPVAEGELDTKVEPTTSLEPTADVSPVPEAEPVTKVEPATVNETVTKAEPAADVVTIAENEPSTKGEPAAANESATNVEPEVVREHKVEVKPVVEAESSAKDEPAPGTETAVFVGPASQVESIAAAEPVVKVESASTIEPAAEATEKAVEVEPATEIPTTKEAETAPPGKSLSKADSIETTAESEPESVLDSTGVSNADEAVESALSEGHPETSGSSADTANVFDDAGNIEAPNVAENDSAVSAVESSELKKEPSDGGLDAEANAIPGNSPVDGNKSGLDAPSNPNSDTEADGSSEEVKLADIDVQISKPETEEPPKSETDKAAPTEDPMQTADIKTKSSNVPALLNGTSEEAEQADLMVKASSDELQPADVDVKCDGAPAQVQPVQEDLASSPPGSADIAEADKVQSSPSNPGEGVAVEKVHGNDITPSEDSPSTSQGQTEVVVETMPESQDAAHLPEPSEGSEPTATDTNSAAPDNAITVTHMMDDVGTSTTTNASSTATDVSSKTLPSSIDDLAPSKSSTSREVEAKEDHAAQVADVVVPKVEAIKENEAHPVVTDGDADVKELAHEPDYETGTSKLETMISAKDSEIPDEASNDVLEVSDLAVEAKTVPDVVQETGQSEGEIRDEILAKGIPQPISEGVINSKLPVSTDIEIPDKSNSDSDVKPELSSTQNENDAGSASTDVDRNVPSSDHSPAHAEDKGSEDVPAVIAKPPGATTADTSTDANTPEIAEARVVDEPPDEVTPHVAETKPVTEPTFEPQPVPEPPPSPTISKKSSSKRHSRHSDRTAKRPDRDEKPSRSEEIPRSPRKQQSRYFVQEPRATHLRKANRVSMTAAELEEQAERRRRRAARKAAETARILEEEQKLAYENEQRLEREAEERRIRREARRAEKKAAADEATRKAREQADAAASKEAESRRRRRRDSVREQDVRPSDREGRSGLFSLPRSFTGESANKVPSFARTGTGGSRSSGSRDHRTRPTSSRYSGEEQPKAKTALPKISVVEEKQPPVERPVRDTGSPTEHRSHRTHRHGSHAERPRSDRKERDRPSSSLKENDKPSSSRRDGDRRTPRTSEKEEKKKKPGFFGRLFG